MAAANNNGTQPLNNGTQPPNTEPLEETYNSSRIKFGTSNVRLFNVKNAPAAVRAAHGFNTTPRKRKAILRPETPNFPNYPVERQLVSPSRKRPFGKSRVVTPPSKNVMNRRQTAAELRAKELNLNSNDPQLPQHVLARLARMQKPAPPIAAAAAPVAPFIMGPGPVAPFTMETTPPSSNNTHKPLKRTNSTLKKGGRRDNRYTRSNKNKKHSRKH